MFVDTALTAVLGLCGIDNLTAGESNMTRKEWETKVDAILAAELAAGAPNNGETRLLAYIMAGPMPVKGKR